MAAETGWHRYGTKLLHCHSMYRCGHVSRSVVCMPVCVLITTVSAAKTDEPIELAFRGRLMQVQETSYIRWRSRSNKGGDTFGDGHMQNRCYVTPDECIAFTGSSGYRSALSSGDAAFCYITLHTCVLHAYLFML